MMREASAMKASGFSAGPGRPTVRFREHGEEDRARARDAVRAWREENPDGSPEQMLAGIGPCFRPDGGPVLRAMLFRADLRDAKVTMGIVIITGEYR